MGACDNEQEILTEFKQIENCKKEYQETLDDVANRVSIPQFFDGNYGKKVQYYNGRKEITNQDFIGLILEYNEKTKIAKVEQRNYFKKGDNIEIFGPDKTIKMKIKDIYDENMNKIDIVRHPKQIVYIKTDKKVEKNYMIKCIDKSNNV